MLRSGVQTAGVLDDLFVYEGPLGACIEADGSVTVSVWAPTAQKVMPGLLPSHTGGVVCSIPI